MKPQLPLTLIVACSAFSCTNISELVARATFTVFVHYVNTGIPEKKVELLETGEVKYTDTEGLVLFTVSPGVYTVRTHDINRGGAAGSQPIDWNIAVADGEAKVLEVRDCPLCK